MKYRKKRILPLAIIATVLLATACTNPATGSQSSNVTADVPPADETVVILHTNDIHSAIDGFPTLATAIASERAKAMAAGQSVFVVSAGDNFSGNPVVDQYNPRGYPIVDAMKTIGYDAATLGNHEFDYGQATLNDRIAQGGFPFVCANVKTSSTSTLSQPPPTMVLTSKGGNKIVVLGLIELEQNGYPASNVTNLTGLTFTAPFTVAARYSTLKTDSKAQAFVVLSHLGYDSDKLLAAGMSSIDVIIGGHSHTVINPAVLVNNVLIGQTGSSLKYLGKIVLTFKGGKLASKTGTLIDLSQVTPDAAMAAKVKAWDDSMNSTLNAVIGTASATISGKAELGSFMTDAPVAQYNLDMYFQNQGGIRIDSIPAGNITKGQIYSMDPFGNMVVVFNLTPAQIRSLVAYSYVAADTFEASGVQVTATQDSSGTVAAANIVLKDSGGNLLDETKTYKVGMNDYIASSFAFDGKGTGVSQNVTSADTLINYIKQKGTIGAYPNTSRVSLTVAAGSGIGHTPVPLSVGSNVYLDFSSAGNLMTDAMRDAAHADIAFYPCGSMNAGMNIAAGVIGDNALRSLFKIYISQNKVAYGSMKGSDIKAFLLARSQAYNDIDVQVSGMCYTMNGVSGKNVTSVDCYLADGTTPLSDTATYIVAFDDYTYANTYSSAISSQVTGLTSTSDLEQDILSAYVKANDPLPASIGTNRITTN